MDPGGYSKKRECVRCLPASVWASSAMPGLWAFKSRHSVFAFCISASSLFSVVKYRLANISLDTKVLGLKNFALYDLNLILK